jgi:hypothetical protein
MELRRGNEPLCFKGHILRRHDSLCAHYRFRHMREKVEFTVAKRVMNLRAALLQGQIWHPPPAALTLSGILSMTIIAGALAFRLRVACKNQSDLVNLIETLRSKAGVQETNTSIILGEVKRRA